MNEIKFGTDGWRGVISENFTFANVRIVAQAAADYFKTLKHKNKNIIVGYDMRYMSEKYAEISAKVLAGNGFSVTLSKRAVSTPVVSWAVVDRQALAGIMITASHNPPEYNGFKVKSKLGAAISPSETKAIESLLGKNAPKNSDKIGTDNLEGSYLKKVSSFVDLKTIKKSKIKVVIEPLWGSSQGYLLSILKGSNLKLFPIHHYRDVLFGGVSPEPLNHNLTDLKNEIKRVHADVGLIADGDGDRVAVMDDKGVFYSTQFIIPLLMLHLLDNKKLRGDVVQTNSVSSAVEIIAKDYGLKVHKTPIGFKYIADLMLKEDILIGGEESGGIGVKGYIPERDGVLMGLLMLEMMAQSGKTIRQLLRDVEKRYGKFCYDRVDIRYSPEKRDKIFKFLDTASFEKIAGMKVKEITRFDGTKFIFEDLSWLLLRGSGTEPVLRIYSESKSEDKVRKLLAFGKSSALSL